MYPLCCCLFATEFQRGVFLLLAGSASLVLLLLRTESYIIKDVNYSNVTILNDNAQKKSALKGRTLVNDMKISVVPFPELEEENENPLFNRPWISMCVFLFMISNTPTIT